MIDHDHDRDWHFFNQILFLCSLLCDSDFFSPKVIFLPSSTLHFGQSESFLFKYDPLKTNYILLQLSSLFPYFFNWNNIPCLVLSFTVGHGGGRGKTVFYYLLVKHHVVSVPHIQNLINIWYHKIKNSYPWQGAHLAENLDSVSRWVLHYEMTPLFKFW